MFAGTALSVCLLVYAGLSLFIICGPYVYMVVCVVYAYNLTGGAECLQPARRSWARTGRRSFYSNTITFDVMEVLQTFNAEDSDEELFNELEPQQNEQVPNLAFVIQNPPENLLQAAVDQQHLYPVEATAYPWMEALREDNWVEPSLEKEAMQGSIHLEARPLFHSALEVTHYLVMVQGQ